MAHINLLVNGIHHSIQIKHNETLLQVLRDRLGLTGAKKGCDCGDCGTCTVIVDGETVPVVHRFGCGNGRKADTNHRGIGSRQQIAPITAILS